MDSLKQAAAMTDVTLPQDLFERTQQTLDSVSVTLERATEYIQRMQALLRQAIVMADELPRSPHNIYDWDGWGDWVTDAEALLDRLVPPVGHEAAPRVEVPHA